MAKKKRSNNNRNNQPREEVKVKNNSQNLNKNVNSLVEEIERTHPMKKIEEKDIEELQSTIEMNAIKKEQEERFERERLEREKREQECIEKEKQERIEREKQERLEREKQEQEKLEKERLERERLEQEKREEERRREEELSKIEEQKEEESSFEEQDDFEKDFSIESKEEKTEKKEELSKTNAYRFSFDDQRLSEADSLDTSFLEGRLKNVSKNTNTNKPMKQPVSKKPLPKTKVSVPHSTFSKTPSLFARRLTCAIVLVIVSFLLGFAISYRFVVKTKIQIEKVDVIKEVKVADDNYVFLGDSITDFYDLEKYYKDLPVINSGINGNNTKDVLDSLKSRVYRYNPSKVFILLGTNDYVSLRRNESIKENITKIIEEIHKNRPLTKVYIESILPVTVVDDDRIHEDFVRARDNKEIEDANKLLKDICKDTKSTYIDIYKLLYDEKEGLKLDCTRDGLHLNDKGYRIVTDEIMKYIKA